MAADAEMRCGSQLLPRRGVYIQQECLEQPACDAGAGKLQAMLNTADSLLWSLYFQHHQEGQVGHAAGRPSLQQRSQAQTRVAYATLLLRFANEASLEVAATLREAAAAAPKAPLLATSTAHCRAFVQLLDALLVLDQLKDRKDCLLIDYDSYERLPSPLEPTGDEEDGGAAAQQELQRFLSSAGAVLASLQARVQPLPEVHMALAAVIDKVHGWLTGSVKGAALSSQQAHACRRALPLLLRMYMTADSRAEALAAGRSELLPAKLLSLCVQLVVSRPVLPCYGDVPVCLLPLLEECPPLAELAQRHPKLAVMPLQQLDNVQRQRLDQDYALQGHMQGLRCQHDDVCDAVSALALEMVACRTAREQPGPQLAAAAAAVVDQALRFAADARARLLELDAWRLDQERLPPHGPDATSRYCLKDGDAAPFLEVLTCLKGVQDLVADCAPWLEPLLRRHAAEQLQAFAGVSLPALAKAHAGSARVQRLARALQSVLLGQAGSLQDLPEDLWMGSGSRRSTGAAADLPARAASGVSSAAPATAGPVAEGLELRMPGFMCRQAPAGEAEAASSGGGPAAPGAAQQGRGARWLQRLRPGQGRAGGEAAAELGEAQLAGTPCGQQAAPGAEQPLSPTAGAPGRLSASYGSEAGAFPWLAGFQTGSLEAELADLDQQDWTSPVAEPALGPEATLGSGSSLSGGALPDPAELFEPAAHEGRPALEQPAAGGSAAAAPGSEQPGGALAATPAKLGIGRLVPGGWRPGAAGRVGGDAAGAADGEASAAAGPSLFRRIAAKARSTKQAAAAAFGRPPPGAGSQPAAEPAPEFPAAAAAALSGAAPQAAHAAAGARVAAESDSTAPAEASWGQEPAPAAAPASDAPSAAHAGARHVLDSFRQTLKQLGGGQQGGEPPVGAIALAPPLAVVGLPASQAALLALLLEQLLAEAAEQPKWWPAGADAARQAQEVLALLGGGVAAGRQLRAIVAQAADLSDLWMAECQPSVQQPPRQAADDSFPAALMRHAAACAMEYMPAETPLAATHVFDDALRRLHARAETHAREPEVAVQAGAAIQGYLDSVLLEAYEHFKTVALHQLLASGLLASCGTSAAAALPPIRPLSFESLLAHHMVEAAGSAVNVRQALTESMDQLLVMEAQQLVLSFCPAGATALLELRWQRDLLRLAHAGLSEHLPLRAWREVWDEADSMGAPGTGGSIVGAEAVSSLAEYAMAACYDSSAHVFVPQPPAAPQDAGQGRLAAAGPACNALGALLAGYSGFLGAAHVDALRHLAGGEGLAALAQTLVGIIEGQVQGPLSHSLLELQPHLPAGLGVGPTFQQRASAEKLLGSYQGLLAGALGQGALCGQALAAMQAAGNCVALLELVEAQLGADGTAVFMQAAPVLGIRAAPAYDDLGGLVMPPPSQPSHFQRMMLGEDARLVVGLPSLLAQSIELTAWQATSSCQVLPSCMPRAAAAVQQLQSALQGAPAAAASAAGSPEGRAGTGGSAAGAGPPGSHGMGAVEHGATSSPGVRDSMTGVLGQLADRMAVVQAHGAALDGRAQPSRQPAGAGVASAQGSPALESGLGRLAAATGGSSTCSGGSQAHAPAGADQSVAAAGPSGAAALDMASPKELMGSDDSCSDAGGATGGEDTADGSVCSAELPSPGPWGHGLVVVNIAQQPGSEEAPPPAPQALAAGEGRGGLAAGASAGSGEIGALVEHLVGEVEAGAAGSSHAASSVQEQQAQLAALLAADSARDSTAGGAASDASDRSRLASGRKQGGGAWQGGGVKAAAGQALVARQASPGEGADEEDVSTASDSPRTHSRSCSCSPQPRAFGAAGPVSPRQLQAEAAGSPRTPRYNQPSRLGAPSGGQAGARARSSTSPARSPVQGEMLAEMYDGVADLAVEQHRTIGELRSANAQLRSEVELKDRMIEVLGSASKMLQSPRQDGSDSGSSQVARRRLCSTLVTDGCTQVTPREEDAAAPAAGAAQPAAAGLPPVHEAAQQEEGEEGRPATAGGSPEPVPVANPALVVVLAAQEELAEPMRSSEESLDVANPSGGCSDEEASSPRAAAERTYPTLPRLERPPAQLAMACGALQLAALLTQFTAGSGQAAADAQAAAAAPAEPAAPAASGGGGVSPSKLLAKVLSSVLPGGGAAASPGRAHGADAPTPRSAASGAAPPPYAFGRFGDGPAWAMCLLLGSSGQQRAFQRLDPCRQLARQWQMDEVAAGPAGAATQQSQHQRLQQLAVAVTRVEQVYQQADACFGQRFAVHPGATAPITFGVLGAATEAGEVGGGQGAWPGEERLAVDPDLDPLAVLLVPDQETMRISADLPLLLQRQSPGKLMQAGGRRPQPAPAKAGIVQAAAARSIMMRYAEAAPSAVVSNSARQTGSSGPRSKLSAWTAGGRRVGRKKAAVGDTVPADQAAAAAGHPAKGAAAAAGRQSRLAAGSHSRDA